MQSVGIDKMSFETVRSKLVYLAWRRFRIPAEQAEDLVQSAAATYLEVQERYTGEGNQLGILSGIFRNKCREHINRSVREQKMIRGYTRKPPEPAATTWLDPDGSNSTVLEDVIRREDSLFILDALAGLSPQASETFRLLLEEDVGRKGLINRLGLNKNTLDSRLHVYRRELRNLLRRKGIAI